MFVYGGQEVKVGDVVEFVGVFTVTPALARVEFETPSRECRTLPRSDALHHAAQ